MIRSFPVCGRSGCCPLILQHPIKSGEKLGRQMHQRHSLMPTNKQVSWHLRLLRHQENRGLQQYLVVFLKFGLFSRIHEGSLSTEKVLPNGAIASGKQRLCCSPSAFVWLQLQVRHQLLSKPFQW